jgi:branched-chain amino acid transport system permease protein
MDSAMILQFLVTGLTNGILYAIVAFGFTMIFSATEIFNFAQGEFVMLGGLLAVTFTQVLHLPIFISFVAVVCIVALIGGLIQRFIISPAATTSFVTLIIITLGTAIFLRGLAMFAWGKNPYALPAFSGEKPIPIFGAVIVPQILWIFGIAIVLFLILTFFYTKTIYGKAMLACNYNRDSARLMGIPAKRMVTFCFMLSGALGAVGGIIIAPVSMTFYDQGLTVGIKGFVAAGVGGMGSPAGALVGGLILGVAEAFGAGFISSAYKDAMAMILLILVLCFKPTGLFRIGTK